ncbi:MAG: PIN domain nuclease [Peptococcaceae bacterium]|nr:PIN domain nuclease [Peptococcaceae bacterium]
MREKLTKTKKIIVGFIAVFFGSLGCGLGLLLVFSDYYQINLKPESIWPTLLLIGGVTIVFLVMGALLGPYIIRATERLIRFGENRLSRIPTADLMGGVFGLIIGLIIASLIGPSLSNIPFIGRYLPLLTSVLLGYLGLSLGIKKREEMFNFNLGRFRSALSAGKEKKKEAKTGESQATEGGPAPAEKPADVYSSVICPPKILDTSVIIDGRVSDIYRTGFLDGVIVIPKFVLTELQHIADSSDTLKRNRGRRGLDILNSMRKDMQGIIQVPDTDFPEVQEVDAKLVRLAQQTGGDILTNDYNLNKVAELQGVRVLNINDLINALKPVFLPGEEMVVQVIKEGKEQRQGIGYLDDGTMIVVDTGRKYINRKIYTVVTSVLQTSAGRMIFVKPKYSDNRVFVEEED